MWRCLRLFAVIPALCLAQVPDSAGTQQLLDELKGIRASLERIEKAQKALLVVVRMQADSSQAAVLEEQRARLASREQELGRESSAAASPPMMMVVENGAERAAPASTADTTRAAQIAAQLKEVSAARQKLDLEIARIRERLAAMDKLIEDALR
jgi:hypothetical protein